MAWFGTGKSSKIKIYKDFGFYSDQAGILRRYNREKYAWENHLNQTKSYILSCASGANKGRCAILGSGWLLDVPVAELADLFHEVWLFDIHHPKSTQAKLSHLRKIKRVECDISGFASEIYRIAKNKKRTIDDFQELDIQPAFAYNLSEFDFVVSCNLLNQLDIILVDYLKRKKHILPEVEKKLRAAIQGFHLENLPVGKTCLVSDVEELWMNQKKEIIQENTLVYTNRLPDVCEKEWIWDFDTHYTYVSEYLTSFQVKAYRL
jgi:hypothetical protein